MKKRQENGIIIGILYYFWGGTAMYQFELFISAQRSYETICKEIACNNGELKNILARIEKMGESYGSLESVRERMRELNNYSMDMCSWLDELGYEPIIIEEKDSEEYARHLLTLAKYTQDADKMKQVISLGEYNKSRMFDVVEKTLDLMPETSDKDFIILADELALIARAREQHLTTWQAKLGEGNETIAKVEQLIKSIDTSSN